MIPLPMQADQTLVPLPEEVVDHYLTILGVARREPSLEALRELLAAHLTRIPFENISKLYYRKRLGLVNLPPIQLYLDGIDKIPFWWHLLFQQLSFLSLTSGPGIRSEVMRCRHEDSASSRPEHDCG